MHPLSPQIEDGEVHASLDQQGGMVSFAENPENYDSLMMAQHIDTQLQSCIALEQKLGALDREMALDPRYVHRVGSTSDYILVDSSTSFLPYALCLQVLGSGLEEDSMFHDEAVM